jgi:hypothetical protein
MKWRKGSNVQGKQFTKYLRAPAKELKSVSLQFRTTVEHEHQSRHHQGTPRQTAVRTLITCKIARSQTLREHCGLAERKSEAFAGDCVDGARSVANQSNIPSPHISQFAIGSDRASFGGRRLCAAEPGVEFGKCRQSSCQAQTGIAGSDRYANLLIACPGAVSLAVLAPIDFQMVGPLSRAKMLAKRISEVSSRMGFEVRPPAYARVGAIRPHNPARADSAVAKPNFVA